MNKSWTAFSWDGNWLGSVRKGDLKLFSLFFAFKNYQKAKNHFYFLVLYFFKMLYVHAYMYFNTYMEFPRCFFSGINFVSNFNMHPLFNMVLNQFFTVSGVVFTWQRCARAMEAPWSIVWYTSHVIFFISRKEKMMPFVCGLLGRRCCTLPQLLEVKLSHQTGLSVSLEEMWYRINPLLGEFM